MTRKSINSSWRRNLRRRRLQVEELSDEAEKQLNKNFIRRIRHLARVKRFALTWIALLLLLIGCVTVQTRALSGYYQTPQPIPGGIYIEGIVGQYTNANPIYATGQANDAVSKLIFASLFKYNDKNKLVGDLATSWDSNKLVDQYTVHLRHGLTWQDGQPLTAQDVVFTYQTIQNPDAQSPLNASWQDVKISATDKYTVVFNLPNPLSSFPYSLTNGIIPQHILKNVPPDSLRSVSFNTTNPIGAGPFVLKSATASTNSDTERQQQIALQPFVNYHDGAPKLSNFVIQTFETSQAMLDSYNDKDLTAMVGLDHLPASLLADSSNHIYQMPLTAANYVFFNNSSSVLSSKYVRAALVEGADVDSILAKLGASGGTRVTEPLLLNQLGYSEKYRQSDYSPEKAQNLLAKAGWKLKKNSSDGLRYNKHNQLLHFTLYAADTPQNAVITRELKRQWTALGVSVQVYLQDNKDIQSTAAYHDYDALLYGISIGADPDVFVYWDSSQASINSASRLNFSEYKSNKADTALEAGRTRTGNALRAIKYTDFLKAWQMDEPALGLYQPNFLYVTRGQVFGFNTHTLNVDTDRYNNVENWMVREAMVTNHN